MIEQEALTFDELVLVSIPPPIQKSGGDELAGQTKRAAS